MQYLKAYKFRIYPNKEQSILLNKTFGSVRFIYNKMLFDKIQHYELTKQTLNNTPAQYKKEFPWLKEVDSLALANAQLNLQTAYKNFFKRKEAGFPKYKSKKRNINSYTTNNQVNTINISNNYKHLNLPKIKNIRIKCHRHISKNEIIKSATISKTPTGKYFVSILVQYTDDVKNIKVNKIIGLDFSMKELYYSSENKTANYPRYYRKAQLKLSKVQKALSRKKKGSKNRNKQRIKVALVHEKIANQRKDFLHKQSRYLVNNFDAVCIEDINMQAMSKCLNFGKSVHDNAWGTFVSFLEYKLKQGGKQLIKINKWFPSSTTCSNCNTIKQDLQLSDRIYECSNCGLVIDRDYNAALNIRRVGTTQIAC